MRSATVECKIVDGKPEIRNASTAADCGDLRTACARTGTRDNDAIGSMLRAAQVEWLGSRDARKLTVALNQIVDRLHLVKDSPNDRRFLDTSDRAARTRNT
jgi:hypothetical protein